MCVLYSCSCCTVYIYRRADDNICITPRKQNFRYQSNEYRENLVESMARSLLLIHRMIAALLLFKTKLTLFFFLEPQHFYKISTVHSFIGVAELKISKKDIINQTLSGLKAAKRLLGALTPNSENKTEIIDLSTLMREEKLGSLIT